MKQKILITFMIIGLILILGGCNKTAKDDKGMIKIAREELPISDSERITVQMIGSINKNGSRLACFMTGNENQGHGYYPVEFKIITLKKYEFIKVYKMYQRDMDIYTYCWMDGYVFIVNNKECKSIELEASSEDRKIIKVDKIPFVFYYNSMPGEYNFLDEKGNVL